MREWHQHSYEKLSILTDYLAAFAKATSGAPNRVYIDAFAGDTENQLKTTGQTFPGSAEAALAVSPPFTHLRLFELGVRRAGRLESMIAEHPGRDARVIRGDCNVAMASALADLPVPAPTFAFLDPDGMELRWSTIRAIADHKRAYAERSGRSKVEMWILFSSAGIVRMLSSNRALAEAEGYPLKVAQLYGAWGPWQAVWDARLRKEISPGDAKKAYLFLYMDRLANLGYEHLLVRPMENSRNELYAMVFVSDHDAGARIAFDPKRAHCSTLRNRAPSTRICTPAGETPSPSNYLRGRNSNDFPRRERAWLTRRSNGPTPRGTPRPAATGPPPVATTVTR